MHWLIRNLSQNSPVQETLNRNSVKNGFAEKGAQQLGKLLHFGEIVTFVILELVGSFLSFAKSEEIVIFAKDLFE